MIKADRFYPNPGGLGQGSNRHQFFIGLVHIRSIHSVPKYSVKSFFYPLPLAASTGRGGVAVGLSLGIRIIKGLFE